MIQCSLVSYTMGWDWDSWYCGLRWGCCTTSDDRWVQSIGRMIIGREKPTGSEKTCISTTLSATDLIWSGFSTGVDLHTQKLMTYWLDSDYEQFCRNITHQLQDTWMSTKCSLSRLYDHVFILKFCGNSLRFMNGMVGTITVFSFSPHAA
jgi:hypothetical protein